MDSTAPCLKPRSKTKMHPQSETRIRTQAKVQERCAISLGYEQHPAKQEEWMMMLLAAHCKVTLPVFTMV